MHFTIINYNLMVGYVVQNLNLNFSATLLITPHARLSSDQNKGWGWGVGTACSYNCISCVLKLR
jgi:hypothetical protein